MESNTPIPQINGYCGIHALYNMGLMEKHILGKQPTIGEFFRAQLTLVPKIAAKHTQLCFHPFDKSGHIGIIFNSTGLMASDAIKIGKRLKLLPIIALNAKDNAISEVASFALLESTKIARAYAQMSACAQEWHNSTGPRVAHFFCCIPEHAIAISVMRMADGSQAMCLYDSLNGEAIHIDHMRQHVEYIYHRFF